MRLSNSTQPSSTSRCPCAGSRPVVSVSRTISRMLFLCDSMPSFRHLSNPAEDFTHLHAHRVESARGIHHEIGAGALFRVRHLLGENRRKFVLAHAGAL